MTVSANVYVSIAESVILTVLVLILTDGLISITRVPGASAAPASQIGHPAADSPSDQRTGKISHGKTSRKSIGISVVICKDRNIAVKDILSDMKGKANDPGKNKISVQ